MYERNHKNTVTLIVLGGHVLIFVYAFVVLSIFGGRISSDFFQLILMASPVLASTALLAFSKLMNDQGSGPRGKKLPLVYTLPTLGFPLLLIVLVGLVFTLFGMQSHIASPDELKISLGVLETFFGGYIGVLAKKLF